MPAVTNTTTSTEPVQRFEKPKRPMNAYMRWTAENRAAIKDELGSDCKPAAILKTAGAKWKVLDAELKKPYEDAYQLDKVRYAKEMESYTPPPKTEKPKKKKSNTVNHVPDDTNDVVPDGWKGPFSSKFMPKNFKCDGKALKFKTFEEAIQEANKHDGCAGITKIKSGYSLRIGPDLKESNTDEISWIKSNDTNQESVESVEKVELVEKDDSEENVEHVENTNTKKKANEPKSKKKTKKTMKVKEPEPEPEPEEEEESDSEDEELDVTPITIDGVEYFKDDEDNIYEPDGDGDPIGKLVDGEIKKE